MLDDSNECLLVTKEDSTLTVIPNRYNVQIIPGAVSMATEPEWLATNFDARECIVIADGYQFDGGYQKAIKGKGFRMIYIDDLVSQHMFADVVINHSPSAKKEKYQHEP